MISNTRPTWILMGNKHFLLHRIFNHLKYLRRFLFESGLKLSRWLIEMDSSAHIKESKSVLKVTKTFNLMFGEVKFCFGLLINLEKIPRVFLKWLKSRGKSSSENVKNSCLIAEFLSYFSQMVFLIFTLKQII